MWILAVLVTLLLWEATSVNTACTFPAELTGVWYSTSFGTLTFTSTSFTGFTSPDLPNTFDCEESSDTKYLVKAPNDVFGERIYLCMEMTAVSAVKYIVRFENNVDNSTGERFYFGPPVGVTLSAGCNRTDTRSGGEYELFIKKDNLSEALTACPGSLMSQFWVVVTSSAAVNCSNTTLDGQQPGLLAFNYSSCVTGMFNKGGILQCLYSTSSDYTYVTLYNNDTTVNGVTTYQFTCMALSKSGSLLTASEYPKRCHTGQTPTSVTSPGILYNMADLLNADNSSSSSNNNVLIIVLCTIGGAIVIAIIIIILYLKIFRKKEEAPKIRKAKSKISITDYTPRMERVSSLEKGVNLVNKQSSGEVLTGIMEGRKNKKVMGDAYEPPKKEKWQKQWEKSPRLDGSLKESKRKSASAVNIPTHELDKAYTVASSLPESVDLPDIPQDTAKRRPADGVPVFSTRLGVLEKSHASPKIPRSTGKFGGSPDSYQFPEEGVPSPPEPRLDTITENPFSRENTGTSGLAKSLREHPDMITGLKNRGADSMNTFRTTSTASAWQIKWETTMRPKTPSPVMKKKYRRSKTPVKLFQNTFDYFKLEDKKKNIPEHLVNNIEKMSPVCNIPNEFVGGADVIHYENKIQTEMRIAVDPFNETAKPDNANATNTRHELHNYDNPRDIRHVTIQSSVDMTKEKDLISIGSTLSRDSELDMAAYSTLNVSGISMDIADGDSISLHAELFWPSEWLYAEDLHMEDIWRKGARSVNSKRKRDFRQFLGVEHERIASNEKSNMNYAKSAFNERKRRVLKRKSKQP